MSIVRYLSVHRELITIYDGNTIKSCVADAPPIKLIGPNSEVGVDDDNRPWLLGKLQLLQCDDTRNGKNIIAVGDHLESDYLHLIVLYHDGELVYYHYHGLEILHRIIIANEDVISISSDFYPWDGVDQATLDIYFIKHGMVHFSRVDSKKIKHLKSTTNSDWDRVGNFKYCHEDAEPESSQLSAFRISHYESQAIVDLDGKIWIMKFTPGNSEHDQYLPYTQAEYSKIFPNALSSHVISVILHNAKNLLILMASGEVYLDRNRFKKITDEYLEPVVERLSFDKVKSLTTDGVVLITHTVDDKLEISELTYRDLNLNTIDTITTHTYPECLIAPTHYMPNDQRFSTTKRAI